MEPAAGEGDGDDGELPAGTRVDKYEIVRRLGEGGMATIYLASSVGPGGFTKPCALKLLRPELSGRDQISRMLVTEARVAAVLNHPSIVQVFDFGEYGRSYFMAMEWVDGVSLGQLLARLMRERRRLTLGAVVHLATQVAEALAYLREGVEIDGQPASLVHRDVSPSNVLLSGTGAVKLTDFGIVKVLDAPTHTRVGVVKGKYAYMAPEQLRAESVDHRADLFSLGVVMFEMLTMARLFHRANVAATIAAVHAARVPPPSSLWPDVPPEIDAIVRKALAKRREDRFESAAEIARALMPFATNTGRAELATEVRALMQTERSTGPQRPISAASVHSDDGPIPTASPDDFDVLEELEDQHEKSALERASELPVARPSTRPSEPQRRALSSSTEITQPPTPQVSLPPRASAPMNGSIPPFVAPTAHEAPQAMGGGFGHTLSPSTTSFIVRQSPRWLPVVVVASAIAATAAFWWAVLS